MGSMWIENFFLILFYFIIFLNRQHQVEYFWRKIVGSQHLLNERWATLFGRRKKSTSMSMNKWWADGDLLQIVTASAHYWNFRRRKNLQDQKKKKRLDFFSIVTPKLTFSRCSQCFHSHQIPTFPSPSHTSLSAKCPHTVCINIFYFQPSPLCLCNLISAWAGRAHSRVVSDSLRFSPNLLCRQTGSETFCRAMLLSPALMLFVLFCFVFFSI